MANYTDPFTDYKWISQEDIAGLTRRNMGILSMLLNSLNVPDLLHEFVAAVFIAGNWDATKEYDEITLQRMAKSMASNLPAQRKLYNRLKQKSPKFFRWQEAQEILIIDRIILHEHTTHHKTKAKYKFIGYDQIKVLFQLPPRTPLLYIRQAMEDVLSNYPNLQVQAKKPKRKRPESTAKASLRAAEETVELTGSIAAANLYLEEAAGSGYLKLLIIELSDEPSEVTEH